MKKDRTGNSKKLVLNKQTIRELRPMDLERPAGGTRGGNQFDDGAGGSDTCPC